MSRITYHPNSVEVEIRGHAFDCHCRGGDPAVVDLRCVRAYVVEVADVPPVVEATRPAAALAALEHARAAEVAMIENHYGEAQAERDMARTWALIARELPEVAYPTSGHGDLCQCQQCAPLLYEQTAVIPRVEPGQGGSPNMACYCHGAPGAHPVGSRGCESA